MISIRRTLLTFYYARFATILTDVYNKHRFASRVLSAADLLYSIKLACHFW